MQEGNFQHYVDISPELVSAAEHIHIRSIFYCIITELNEIFCAQ